MITADALGFFNTTILMQYFFKVTIMPPISEGARIYCFVMFYCMFYVVTYVRRIDYLLDKSSIFFENLERLIIFWLNVKCGIWIYIFCGFYFANLNVYRIISFQALNGRWAQKKVVHLIFFYSINEVLGLFPMRVHWYN
jgi:hypothetical protein